MKSFRLLLLCTLMMTPEFTRAGVPGFFRMPLKRAEIFGAKMIRITSRGPLGSISRNPLSRTLQEGDAALLESFRKTMVVDATNLTEKQFNQWNRIVDKTFSRLGKKGLTYEERHILKTVTRDSRFTGFTFSPGVVNRSSMATGSAEILWRGETRLIRTGARVTGANMFEDGVRISLNMYEKSIHELSHVARGLWKHPSEVWYAAEDSARTLAEIMSNTDALGDVRAAVMQTKMAGYITPETAAKMLELDVSPSAFPSLLEGDLYHLDKFYE